MISLQKSAKQRPGSRWVALLLGSSLFVFASCVSRHGSVVEGDGETEVSAEASESAVQSPDPSEYSIKQDRSQFDDLRKSIPEDVRQKNDELSLVLNLMKEYKASPSDVRRKFDKVMRKKRDAFNKKMKKSRDKYNKDERKKRDAFLKYLKEKRDDAKKLKMTREQNREFQRDYREERDEFFNEQKEKRYEFDSEYKEKSKEFEAYTREKRKEFSDELRAYTKGYYDFQKNMRLKKKMKTKEQTLRRRGKLPNFHVDNQQSRELQEFDIISTKPATTLSTDGE